MAEEKDSAVMTAEEKKEAALSPAEGAAGPVSGEGRDHEGGLRKEPEISDGEDGCVFSLK